MALLQHITTFLQYKMETYLDIIDQNWKENKLVFHSSLKEGKLKESHMDPAENIPFFPTQDLLKTQKSSMKVKVKK